MLVPLMELLLIEVIKLIILWLSHRSLCHTDFVF